MNIDPQRGNHSNGGANPTMLPVTNVLLRILFGLLLAGLLGIDQARAEIALQDGSTTPITSTSSSVSKDLTVTPGASVLVVSLFDRNGVNTLASPAFLTWSVPGYGDQTLTRVVAVNNANSTWADSDIYYLFNPNPGTATITATDTSGGTVSAMTMQVYTLSGVDTAIAPVTYSTNNANATTLTLALGDTPFMGWAVVNSSYGTGNNVMFVAASGGTVNCPEVRNVTSQAMGYVANIFSGCTITANGGAGQGVQKMALGVAVFTPNSPGPTAPMGLTATAGTNQVALAWNDSSAGAATSYVVWRGTGGQGYFPIATNTGNASTTYTDTGLPANTTFFYVVQAVGATGTGPFSTVVSATPKGVAPATPTNLVATAQTNQVALSWTDASGGAATSYILSRSITDGSGYLPIATLAGNASTSYTDRIVYDGTSYYYVVQASSTGGTSVPSSQASATPFFALPPGLAGNIALLDGGTNSVTTVASGAGSSISTSFAVSKGAGVLVVELWDRNTFNNHSSPAFMTWSNDVTGTTQNLVRAVSAVSGASTYSDCNIYYLFNPAPGSGTISGTDTNTVTIQGLTMLPFTLTGVDTTVAPATYSVNSASATYLSIATAATTPAGAWAAVLSYDGNTGHPITNASTSGTSTYINVANNQQQALGYVSGLAAGSSTISMTEGTGGGATKCTLAVAVFMPAIGTGIALHDGSVYSTSSTGSGIATIEQPFGVSQGASVMVVALLDNNNNPRVPAPDLVWSNATFGIAQPLLKGIETNSAAYTWIWTTLYYLMDPLPGNGVVTGTDTNSTHNYMSMQVYTLNGVDTTAVPFGIGMGQDATTLSIDTPPETVVGSCAAVMSVNYNSGGGNNVTITSTSGGVLTTNSRPGVQCTMGYVTNLAGGVSTVTATATGGATHMDLAAEIFSPLGVLSAPMNVQATAETGQISLSWADGSGGAATGYIVLRSVTSGSGYTAIATNLGNTATAYLDTRVVNWTTYYYVIEALGPAGISVYSAQVSAAVTGLPGLVTGLRAAADIHQVNLTWNSQLGADSFNVLRSTTSGAGFTLIGNSTTHGFTDSSVADGTLYYYQLAAVNSFGTGATSGQVSAIPVAAFFTNWIGAFKSDADIAGWTTLSGSPTPMFYWDAPLSGPSLGCLVMDATYGPGGTSALHGLRSAFSPSLNLSTYPYLELDIKNEGLWDQWGQIQAIQLNLQVPVNGNPMYTRGTWGDIVLYASATGGEWTHYTVPLSNWAAYNLSSVTALGINLYDGNCATATALDPGFANISFSGAPAWVPLFSGVNNRTIASGSTSVTLIGTVNGTIAGTNIYLASGSPISVTINGRTQNTVISDSTGSFTLDFDTTGFADGTYPITYTAASDMVALLATTNASTSLTLTVNVPPTAPSIQPPTVDASGANLVLHVPTEIGHTYYLLSTTSLAPPVVWTTNYVTAGTGGTIMNQVPINKSQPALFLRYLVQ